MKLAVILGVVHMSFGIMMKGANALYFKSTLDFLCEFVPQIIFMVMTFGYMDFLIFWKWASSCIPAYCGSIITTMINIPLNMGKTSDISGSEPIYGPIGGIQTTLS